MNKPVEPIPAEYRGATPYITVQDAAAALDFYRKAFGAKVVVRMDGPDGKVGHAEIRIGDAIVMLADEFPAMGNRSPKSLGGTPVCLMVYVKDVDSFVAQALAAGAVLKRPVADQFYGDRSGGVEDPFGHMWWFATHKEDVPPEELQKRAAAMAGSK